MRARARLLRLTFVVAAGAFLAACRIEDRTPTGSRRDEAAIRAVVRAYYAALDDRDWARCRGFFWKGATFASVSEEGDTAREVQSVPVDSLFAALALHAAGVADSFDLQVVRTEIRQEGDLAGVWVLTRTRDERDNPGPDEDAIEHLLFRRVEGEWRISNLTRTVRPTASRL